MNLKVFRVRVNLKELRSQPLPESPEHIKQIAQKYAQNNEKFNVFPTKVLHNGDYYYYVTYYYKKNEEEVSGLLIVREDGSIPSHQDSIVIRDYISGVEKGLENVFVYGSEWASRPLKPWKDLTSLLDSVANIVQASNDPEFKKGFDTFYSVPQFLIKTQHELKEIVENAKDYFREITIDYVITKEMHDKIQNNFRRMMDIMKEQFEIQVNTEDERTIFMKKLKKSVSSMNILHWIRYYRIRKYHIFFNADPASMALYNELKDDFYREKASEPIRQEMIRKIRNPRS